MQGLATTFGALVRKELKLGSQLDILQLIGEPT